MKRRPSRVLAVTRTAALLGVMSAQLWCATNDDSPSPAPITPTPDAGLPETARAEDVAIPPPPLTCTASFCRVPLEGADGVALNGISARAENDVWLVGSAGFAAHFDGSSWTKITTGTKQSLFSVNASRDAGPVWGTSTGNTFFTLDRPAAEGGVEVIDGGFSSIVTAIAVASSGEAYAVGSVYSSDPFSGDPTIGDNIWKYAAGPKDAGSSWRPVSPPCPYFSALGCVTLHAAWIESAEVQWFAGQDGKVYRTGGVDAGRLQLTEVNSSSLRTLEAIWGAGENDLWAVGAQGTIRHWAGGDAWAIASSPVTVDLHAVWGSRTDDVWAVGDEATAIHWDGKVWSVAETPFGETNRPSLYAVSGTGRDVWIAGESTLLRAARPDGGAP